ncbi:MAG TPA: cysteine hydrolase family protein [Chryseosolibacter sp.]|nr:cysteine hydrolase family protein [Chryseosolibacter sp.]
METPALILIDIQNGFDDLAYWGNRNNPDAERNASRLLHHWRKSQLPVFHIRHDSSNKASRLAPGQAGNSIKAIVSPLNGEAVIAKNVNSAFIGTDLKERLDKQGIRTLVVAGLTTDHCVSITVRMAGNFGYTTLVASDATATFDRTGMQGEKFPASLVHNTALASLHGEFATVLSTEELLKKF